MPNVLTYLDSCTKTYLQLLFNLRAERVVYMLAVAGVEEAAVLGPHSVNDSDWTCVRFLDMSEVTDNRVLLDRSRQQ